MSYILMFYYNPLNPPFLRGTWSKIISLNSYEVLDIKGKPEPDIFLEAAIQLKGET